MSNNAAVQLRCFFEQDTTFPLARRSLVEAFGTCLLVIAMVGAGLAAARGAPADRLAASLTVAVSIAGALVGLIVALGKVSGGHFNPLITLSQWISGERNGRCTFFYVVGQVVGGIVGARIAALMFGAVSLAEIPAGMSFASLAASEGVAACGLMVVVLGCGKSSRWETGPFAVGSWLIAAILATPTTSYANPAVTIAAIFGAGPTEVSADTAVIFVLAQLLGAFLAKFVIAIAYPPSSGVEL
jgi:glycerol uptake facilitator-like aquaporin